MAEHPIQGLMKTAMENLREMIDVNTIVGDPIETTDGIIIPISKVGFGFVAGGADYDGNREDRLTDRSNEQNHPFGGGSGGGISITPIAFLVVNSAGVKLVSLEASTHLYERLLDMAPQVVDRIQGMVKQLSKRKDSSTEDLFPQ